MDFSLVILGHLVGDFIFQTDKMAIEKKRYFLCSLLHGWLVAFSIGLLVPTTVLQYGLITLTHAIIDYTDFVVWFMVAKGSEDFTKPPFAPHSIFYVDATIHLVTYYLIFNIASPHNVNVLIDGVMNLWHMI
jgi:hypothetical protein